MRTQVSLLPEGACSMLHALIQRVQLDGPPPAVRPEVTTSVQAFLLCTSTHAAEP